MTKRAFALMLAEDAAARMPGKGAQYEEARDGHAAVTGFAQKDDASSPD